MSVPNVLYCGQLSFEKEVGEFTADCFGDGWNAFVTFRVYGEDQRGLDRLSGSINEEIKLRRTDRIFYSLFTYPLFIYLFLFISLIVWLFMKAVRFVKAG